MVSGEALKEAVPDHSGGLIWMFLMDLTEEGLTLAPEMDSIVDAWS
jgi:hypothetical protein